MPTDQLLTYSRIDSFKRCRKMHFWAYEVGIRKILDAKALRQGTAFHAGLDALKCGRTVDDAADAIRECYAHVPAAETDEQAQAWDIECETIVALVSGYWWRWESFPLKVIATEQAFRLPLINPETGSFSKIWEAAGKIDGIVELEDKRLAVLEHKTVSDEIEPDSDYWRRLQLDHQITLYVWAARKLGYNVSTVLYDVARKPTIRPSLIPMLDPEGCKIVLDPAGNRVRTKDGKKWRETADAAAGYVLQSRPMTADEWVGKLIYDIAERPDWYYARREIPRLDQDVNEFLAELWDIQKTVRDAQVNDRWFRTVGRDNCTFCSYFALCSSKFNPQTGLIPEGFHYIVNRHPELGEEENADTSTSNV